MLHPINEWPEQDRPREKLIEKGSSALTDAELLAILINTGSSKFTALDLAKKLLTESGNLDRFSKFTFNELKGFKGIGPAKAVTLLAAIELSKRLHSAIPEKKIIIKTPEEVYKYFGYKYVNETQEIFSVIFLDTAGQVIRHQEITKGTINQTLIGPREIFTKAIEFMANSIILMHNHPSGNPEPSESDKNLTDKVVRSGELIGIKVVDHVIIAGKTFTSFAQRDLM